MDNNTLAAILEISGISKVYKMNKSDDAAIKNAYRNRIYVPMESSSDEIGEIIEAGRYGINDPDDDWGWARIDNSFPNNATLSCVAWTMFYFCYFCGHGAKCFSNELDFFVIVPKERSSWLHVLWAKKKVNN